MPRPKVLIADDHVIVVEGLRRILEKDFDVIETVGDGRELLRAIEQLRPDVAFVDVSMPLLNGIYATRRIVKKYPHVRVVIFTMHADVEIARQALAAGASGYVLKRSPVTEITAAVTEVMKGNVYLSPLVTRDVLYSLQSESTDGPSDVHSRLSAREKEVLQLSAEGCTHKEVATALKISVKTAQFHRYNIKKKLGLRTVAELTQYAIKHRIIDSANTGMMIEQL